MQFAQRERLRLSYRPSKVDVLFVGESPPASGRFFYAGDSGLYRAMLEAFKVVDPNLDEATFLRRFADIGCYLVDLCPEPVDRLPLSTRRATHDAGVELLSVTIAGFRPSIVAPLLRSIVGPVRRSLRSAVP